MKLNRIIYIVLLFHALLGLTAMDCQRRIADKPPVGEVQEPNIIAMEATTVFKNIYPTTSISWNARTGYVRQISNFLGPVATELKDPSEIAKEFLLSNAAMFGFNPDRDQLVLIHIDEAKSKDGEQIRSTFIRFQQFIKEIPVYEGEIIVHLTASNRPYAVYNSLSNLEHIELETKLTSEEAIEIAKKAVTKKIKICNDVNVALIIFPKVQYGIRAWQVDVGQWRVAINASNGEVLMIRDMAYYQQARVYLENNAVNNGNTSIVPITNLNLNATTLTGTRVTINNNAGPLTISNTQQFLDPPGDINFDDQMVYTHTNNIFTFFNSLDIPLPNNALTANTNVNTESCNAAYLPINDSFFYFVGVAGTCQSSAHFADIIYHETTHRVLTVGAGLTGNSDETQAIHEGTGDYFAASVTGNSCLYEQFQNRACERDIEPDRNYPIAIVGESHNDGLIWGSVLWNLQGLLGKQTADRLIREGMRGLPANATFSDYAGNMITQGSAYYGNFLDDNAWLNYLRLLRLIAIVEKCKTTFCSQGIAAPYGTFIERTITTPGSGQTLDITIDVPPGHLIDTDRGCKSGYDITSIDGNEWDEIQRFYAEKDKLEIYQETLNSNSLRILMKAPGGCSVIPTATLRYIVYYKYDDIYSQNYRQ